MELATATEPTMSPIIHLISRVSRLAMSVFSSPFASARSGFSRQMLVRPLKVDETLFRGCHVSLFLAASAGNGIEHSDIRGPVNCAKTVGLW